MQNEARAGSDELVEMAKATKSVSEVTLIDVAAWPSAWLIRSAIGPFLGVWFRAFTITKESST